jgi:hypothetical protein
MMVPPTVWKFALGLVFLTSSLQTLNALSFGHIGHVSVQPPTIRSMHRNFYPSSLHSTTDDEIDSASPEPSVHSISPPISNTTIYVVEQNPGGTVGRQVSLLTKTQPTKEANEPIPRRPLVRFIDNVWFIVCTPFPDLRKLSRKRENDSKFVASIRLRDGFAAVLAYLALGVVSYRYIFEKWSFIDSLYFTCCTFATIGYGDIVAKSVAGKFFSCLFGISGIALLGAAVARIGSRLVEAEIDAVKVARKQSQRQILQVYDRMPKAVLKMRRSSHKNQKKMFHEARELLASIPHPHFSPFLTTFWKAARFIIQSLTVVALGGLVIGYLEGWKWYDSLYYGLITGK